MNRRRNFVNLFVDNPLSNVEGKSYPDLGEFESAFTGVISAYKYLIENQNTQSIEYKYTEETIGSLKKALQVTAIAYVYAKRIDRLIKDKDSEQTFMEGLHEEINEEIKTIM